MKITSKLSKKKALALTIIVVVLSVVLAFFLGLFKKDKTEDSLTTSKGKYAVYYVNLDKDGLVTEYCDLKSSTIQGKADELKLIIEKNSMDGKYISVKPSNLKVNKVVLTDNILNISFGSQYDELTKVEKLLIKAAYVLTFTQVTGIDYVSFYVNDQPLTDASGNVVGALSANNFIDFMEDKDGQNKLVQITLYISNKSGDKLKKVTKSCEYLREESLEEFILTKLFESDDSLESKISSSM
jgi:germination protein M